MASRYFKESTRPIRSGGSYPTGAAGDLGAEAAGKSLKDAALGYKPAGKGSSTNFNKKTKVPVVKCCVKRDGLSY